MSGISVETSSSILSIAEPWRNLVERAAANVFMDPTALNTVHATAFAKVHVLLAWENGAEPPRLVGVWALGERRVTPLGPAVLAAPPYDYSFLSSPVVDPAFMDEVVAGFLATIENHPRLPKVINLKYLDGESLTSAALLKALAARGSRMRRLSERARPFASREAGVKGSGSTRKKLRQDWNRLSAAGVVDIVNDRTPEAVGAAFETFLALEARSWKGEQGTAFLSKPADAAFARHFIGNLVAERKASVALLLVDGRAIAAQVLLYCGRMAYTWKTAFDAEYAKYSPGALLVDRITDELFATEIEAIESCSPEGGFMAQLWSGRRTTLDLLVNVAPGKSLAFTLAALRETGYAELKTLRNRLRALRWPALAKRKLAASR
jgi:hypothetical protein